MKNEEICNGKLSGKYPVLEGTSFALYPNQEFFRMFGHLSSGHGRKERNSLGNNIVIIANNDRFTNLDMEKSETLLHDGYAVSIGTYSNDNMCACLAEVPGRREKEFALSRKEGEVTYDESYICAGEPTKIHKVINMEDKDFGKYNMVLDSGFLRCHVKINVVRPSPRMAFRDAIGIARKYF